MEWSVVFIIAAEVYLFGTCIYVILANGLVELDQKKDGHLDQCHSTILGPEKSHLMTCPY